MPPGRFPRGIGRDLTGLPAPRRSARAPLPCCGMRAGFFRGFRVVVWAGGRPEGLRPCRVRRGCWRRAVAEVPEAVRPRPQGRTVAGPFRTRGPRGAGRGSRGTATGGMDGPRTADGGPTSHARSSAERGALMAGGRESCVADGTMANDGRLRDLEAEAFRTGRTLAEHSGQLAAIREQQHTAFGNLGSLANAIGAPGEHRSPSEPTRSKNGSARSNSGSARSNASCSPWPARRASTRIPLAEPVPARCRAWEHHRHADQCAV